MLDWTSLQLGKERQLIDGETTPAGHVFDGLLVIHREG